MTDVNGYTPGLIGIIAQETSRYTMFSASVTGLELPPGAVVKWQFGHAIADNCNALVREMYELEKEWLWLLGDDHTFGAQTLVKLLEHNVDVVVPLVIMRAPPYAPVIYSGWGPSGAPHRQIVDLDDHPNGGLITVHSAGSAGMLIHRRVFDALTDPWFEAGALEGTQLGEDVYFCDKAREVGATVWCDLDTKMGHCLTAVAWPVKEETGWTFGFSMMGGFQIVLPPGTQTRQS